jgi:hypothetical protein
MRVNVGQCISEPDKFGRFEIHETVAVKDRRADCARRLGIIGPGGIEADENDRPGQVDADSPTFKHEADVHFLFNYMDRNFGACGLR